MRILVTGGAGFIGSHVVDRYVELGHDVAVVDDLSNGLRANVHPAARLYPMDIADAALARVLERERPEVVSHHAAQVDVRRSTADPVADARINLIGGLNVLVQAVRHGVRKVIYSSSGGAVYGEPEYMPVDEDHPIRPRSEYGLSKYALERYLELYADRDGLDYTVLRYPNVYGPRQAATGEGGVIGLFARRMAAGLPCTIHGDGAQGRDFVHVSDCVSANALVLDGRGSRRVYNLGWGGTASVLEVFEALARITGYAMPPVFGPMQVGETRVIALDAGRARDDLGWAPRVALTEGLTDTVAWCAESGG